jgi:glutathione S-transferase
MSPGRRSSSPAASISTRRNGAFASSRIAESNAILCYLAEGTPYLPADRFERAQVMQWLLFEQSYVEPQIGSLRYWTLTGKLAKRSEDMVAGKRAYSLRALAALERHLATRKFLVAERYTIADMSIYAYAAHADEAGLDLERYPAFRAWIARVEAQPGFLGERFPYTIDPHASREL